ncbi:hypothetical protein GGX14DRAFT_694635 [Mycena pura]|uniref:RNI-like protein n=1 Tax=Mycena pura TaxID=153505 RepID=A0AAD6YL89_9AGAR|nr:hypothetical protein GGX14DRAFT_694635 [Mycena pura]
MAHSKRPSYGLNEILQSLRIPSQGSIDRMDANLTSVRGAQEVVSMISSRRSVTKLILGHNNLADDGCVVLFKFLASSAGRRYRITEISLNSNSIGNRGLKAISEYLRGNHVLEELFLQNNRFTGDADTLTSFATALNSSRLKLLSLTTNRNLSDPFLQVFLPLLDSPHLGELQLSAIGLTPEAAPFIVTYLSSPRCRLHTLKCNGNSLGFRAVRSIIRAVKRHNFTLITLEMYANHTVGPVNSDNTSEDDEDAEAGTKAGLDAWKACEVQIRIVLLRNAHLKRETEKEALLLLRCARPLLLSSAGPARAPIAKTGCSESSCAEPDTADTVPKHPPNISFPFTSLPTELQLYMMSFLAPVLSPAQRIRIYTYAASPTTLPRAGLFLPGLPRSAGVCVSDTGSWAGSKCKGLSNTMALVHRKDEQRAEWLRAMGCSAYDPHREGD